MQRLETMQEGAPGEVFEAGYAEARKLIEQDDLDGAIDRLDQAKPGSSQEVWAWTDLMVALLFEQGRFPQCHGILSQYDSRYPGDRRVERAMLLLRHRWPRCPA